MADPVSGPLTREELRRLVDAPFGKAREAIQKHDPLWGLHAGEKIEYEVRVSGFIQGTAYVKAATQEEADKLADKLTSGDVDWDYDDELDVLSVEPYIRARKP